MVWITLLCFSSYGQDSPTYGKRWEELNKGIKYGQSNRYDGPKKGFIYPGPLSEDNSSNKQYELQPPQDNVIYSREKRYKNGDNNGVKENIKKGEGNKLNDIDKPKTEAPEIDYPKWKGPNWDMEDGAVFRFIFILIIIVLLAYLIYYFFFKNKIKSDKNLTSIDYNNDNEINPETIQENQLTTEIEKAIANNDYRLAVRIYYILLLKTLIERDWIKWEKRKTNTHYLIEMSGREEYESFNRAIRIFEWSWYGKNNPSPDTYQRFSQFFDEFVNQLKDEE